MTLGAEKQLLQQWGHAAALTRRQQLQQQLLASRTVLLSPVPTEVQED